MRRGNTSYNFDRYVTIFSQEGRLFQIEYALKASNNFNSTSIGVKGVDTVCGIIDNKNIELLNDQYNISNYFFINDNIGCICSGLPGDILMFNQSAIEEASEYFNKFRQNISIEYLTKKISEKNQINTQYSYTRPLGVKSIILGIENEIGPKVYKLDSSGYFNSHLVCAIGEKEHEINKYVLKKSKYYISNNFPHLITVANSILLLQRVLKNDIKSTDLKIIVSTIKRKQIKTLTQSEIDRYLVYLESL
jgi:20S proteasome subunit alpha 1